MNARKNFNAKFSKISAYSVSAPKNLPQERRYEEQPTYIRFIDFEGVEYAFLGMTDKEIAKCEEKSFYPFKMVIPRSFQLVRVGENLTKKLGSASGVEIDMTGHLYEGKPKESVMLNVCLNINDNPIQLTENEEDNRKPFHPCDVVHPLQKGGGICAHHIGTIQAWGDPSAANAADRKTKYKPIIFYVTMEDIVRDDVKDRTDLIHKDVSRYPRTHSVQTKMEYYFGKAPGYFFIPVQKPDGAVSYFGMANNGSDKTRESLLDWITKMNNFHPKSMAASVQIDDWLFIPVDQWSVFICRDAKLIIE